MLKHRFRRIIKKYSSGKKPYKYFNSLPGTGLGVEGEVTSVTGDVAFLTNETYYTNGSTIQYVVVDDSWSCLENKKIIHFSL